MLSDSPAQELRISNVFVIPGHIFVAVTSKDGILPQSEDKNTVLLASVQ